MTAAALTAEQVSLAITLPQHEPDLYQTERAELRALVGAGYACEWPPSTRRYCLTTPGANAVIAWLRLHGHDAAARVFERAREAA
ncbi:MAG: hypothetical protein U0324_46210 [Polyangiales bacterium]